MCVCVCGRGCCSGRGWGGVGVVELGGGEERDRVEEEGGGWTCRGNTISPLFS